MPLPPDDLFPCPLCEGCGKLVSQPTTAKDLLRYEDWLQREYRRIVQEVRSRLKVVQQACPHTNKRYHPDPLGNSDSWHECLDCGAEV